MLEQRKIAHTAALAFSALNIENSEEKLYKLMESWIGDLDIIQHKILPCDKVMVIAQDIEQSDEKSKYYLFRLFPIGNKWEVSVDCNEVSHSAVLAKLFESVK